MTEHKHGEMDVTAQTATYNGFLKVTVKFVVACLILVLFLAVFRI